MAVTMTKAIVVFVLWVCLIGVGYLTSTGSLARAFNLQKDDGDASASDSSRESVNGNDDRDKSALRDDGNWFDYDPRANGGMMLSIASKRIAEAGSREQRWIASAAGIKSSIGRRGSIGNNDNDNNGIKASASLLLNGPSSPTRLNSHLKPTSSDPDPIATQVHEPIVLSQDEKYQIINGVEESSSEESIENEGNISQNHLLYDNDPHFEQRQKQQQQNELENEADTATANSIAGGISGENDNERESRKKAGKSRKKFLSKHFPNSELVSVSEDNENGDATTSPTPGMQCGHLQPYLATLVRQIRMQEQDREYFRQLSLQQERKFETSMAHLNLTAKVLTTESMRITDMESSINQQLKIMNERLEASVEKIIAASTVSQIILQLSKESFHQMDRIQETTDDVLFQVRALKTELGDVGQASVQAIYNIQRSEENLMKQLGESWNRTIYALRQEPGRSAAAASSATATSAAYTREWHSEQMQPHHDQPRNRNQQQHASSSSSAPSPRFAQEEFIQADAAPEPSSINRNDDDRSGNEALSLPAARTNDGRQDTDAGMNDQGERNAANNNSFLQLSPNRARASGSASERSSSVTPCSSREKLINHRNTCTACEQRKHGTLHCNEYGSDGKRIPCQNLCACAAPNSHPKLCCRRWEGVNCKV